MKRIRQLKSRINQFIRQRPLLSFFVALGLLLLAIVGANYLGKPPVQEEAEVVEKQVEVFSIGRSARTVVQGKVEKTGLVVIAAQTAGVVNRITVTEGEAVASGKNLLQLSSTYTGSSIASQQLALARAQLTFQNDTQALQTELIGKQRELAEKNAENTEELRLISQNSLNGLREQLNLNTEIINSINANLTTLEETNVDGSNDEVILATKQLKSQYLSARSQLEQAINTTDYQINTEKPPTQIATISKDVALKQLDLQEKSLALNHELARINYAIAAISASMMAPSAPFAGKVERVHVLPSQQVTPGMPLVTLSGQAESAKIVVAVPSQIAERVSVLEKAELLLGDEMIPLETIHITSEALSDQLARVVLAVPEHALAKISHNNFVSVALPLGYPEAVAAVPVIPIDTVHQTQKEAYVYVIEDGKVANREVSLGMVLGDKVEVTKGLSDGDVIIVDRNVATGEAVTSR